MKHRWARTLLAILMGSALIGTNASEAEITDGPMLEVIFFSSYKKVDQPAVSVQVTTEPQQVRIAWGDRTVAVFTITPRSHCGAEVSMQRGGWDDQRDPDWQTYISPTVQFNFAHLVEEHPFETVAHVVGHGTCLVEPPCEKPVPLRRQWHPEMNAYRIQFKPHVKDPRLLASSFATKHRFVIHGDVGADGFYVKELTLKALGGLRCEPAVEQIRIDQPVTFTG